MCQKMGKREGLSREKQTLFSKLNRRVDIKAKLIFKPINKENKRLMMIITLKF